MSLFGDLLGEVLGAAARSVSDTAKDYVEYTSSGQYENDKETGKSNSAGMSDRALYKAMKDSNRSAGERVAYKDELKNRGY